MKNYMKYTATVLALSASLSLVAQASGFTDMTNHWASSFVQSAAEAGLMSGVGNNKFSPDKVMTYGEFAVVVVNGAFGGEVIFTDSDSHWADPYLNVLRQNGLFNSATGESVISVTSTWQDQSISREDAATVIARLMDSGNFSSGTSTTGSNLSDLSKLSTGQKQDVRDMIANGIMTGAGSSFGVGNSLTRAESCVMISSMLQKNVIKTMSDTSTSTTTPNTETTTNTVDFATKQAEYIAEVFRLVNEERAKVGLSAYTWNDTLMEAAQFKTDEMEELNYLSHTSPIYGDFSGIINLFLTNYGASAENIAGAYSSPAAVMDGWMNSSGHKAAILSQTYTQIGIGYSGNYWTQQFTSKAGTPVNGSSDSTTEIPNNATSTETPDTTTDSTTETTTPNTDSSTQEGGIQVNFSGYNGVSVKEIVDKGQQYPNNSDPYRLIYFYFDQVVPEGMEIASVSVDYAGAEVSSYFFHNDKDYCSVSLKNIPENVEDITITMEFKSAYRCVLYSGGSVSFSIPDGDYHYIPNGTTFAISFLDANTGSLEVKDSSGNVVAPNKTETKTTGIYTTTYQYYTMNGSNLHVYPSPPNSSSNSTTTGSTTSDSTTSDSTTSDSTTSDSTTSGSTTSGSTTSDSTTSGNSSNSSNAKTIEEMVQEVFEIVNQERAAVGLPAYLLDPVMCEAAQYKCDEMAELNYYSHTSPTYGDMGNLFDLFNIKTTYYVAENIYKSPTTAEAAMTGWMNSSGHKANILHSDMHRIGIGYNPDGHYWTQLFASGTTLTS